jgi:digeranylgeranylglycerophospholipid reductase
MYTSVTKLYDVIVVGAGPVGSYVAYKLAGMGYGVVVLERRERLGEQVCCTGIIGQECVSSFAVDESVILRRANSAKLFSPSGRLLRLWREETQACIIDRAAFDLAMANRAQAKGVQYILNSPVHNIEVWDNKVRVEAAHQEERSSFEARAIVIATGFGSRLIDRLGLGKVSDFVRGAQTEVPATDIDEVEVYFGKEIAPGFFAWLVPTSPHRALVGLLSRRSPGLYLGKLMSSLVAQGKIVAAEAEFNYGGIPLQPLAKTCAERLIVVGDAAGQVKPTTGGGIYYGLLCADIAANTLHQALASNALSAKSLADYEREWRRKLGRELRTGYWARKFYERLSDGQIDRIFDIIKSYGIDQALLRAEELSFDWHGAVVLRLLKHRAVSKAIEMVRLPFHLGGGSEGG